LARKAKLQLGKLQYLPVSQIQPSSWGIRKSSRTNVLHGPIKELGVLQNVICRPLKEGGYKIVSGDGRLQQAKRLGFEKIPAMVINCNEKLGLLVHGIENLARDDLNAAEQGALLSELHDQGFSLKQISQMLGGKLSISTVGTRIELVEKLNEKVQQAVVEGKLPLTVVEAALDELGTEGANKALSIMVDKRVSSMPEALQVLKSIKPTRDIHALMRKYSPRKHVSEKELAQKNAAHAPNWIQIYKLDVSGEIAGVDDKGVYVKVKDPNRTIRVRLFEQIETMKSELMKKARHGDLLSFSVKLESPLVEEPKGEKPQEVPVIAAKPQVQG
jgi:ParB/RepB/Spo0J family partition protein